jgi:hypothetical protein
MNSDGGKLYMKIVEFDEIYKFVVQNFYIWSHLHSQIIDKLSRSQEIYKFVVQSFYIWSHLDSQIIEKLSRSQTEMWIVYRLFDYEDDFKWKSFELQSCRSRRKSRSYLRGDGATRCIVLQIFFWPYIFCKKRGKKNVKKIYIFSGSFLHHLPMFEIRTTNYNCLIYI